ncbi:hypothetical protein CC_1789 [Caulobacter vibrioides CB15]|uniref:Uncharacterized protein n=1 Tax=Caulobacter vibrioides (strain ATCC 19089 / CIP 103742 / CB 15) TaxID=190650 RepID=Q9A7D4_CAUVC|nr:hypothetical protein CC_1789 [Caulobacter vibrioides CB15]
MFVHLLSLDEQLGPAAAPRQMQPSASLQKHDAQPISSGGCHRPHGTSWRVFRSAGRELSPGCAPRKTASQDGIGKGADDRRQAHQTQQRPVAFGAGLTIGGAGEEFPDRDDGRGVGELRSEREGADRRGGAQRPGGRGDHRPVDQVETARAGAVDEAAQRHALGGDAPQGEEDQHARQRRRRGQDGERPGTKSRRQPAPDTLRDHAAQGGGGQQDGGRGGGGQGERGVVGLKLVEQRGGRRSHHAHGHGQDDGSAAEHLEDGDGAGRRQLGDVAAGREGQEDRAERGGQRQGRAGRDRGPDRARLAQPRDQQPRQRRDQQGRDAAEHDPQAGQARAGAVGRRGQAQHRVLRHVDQRIGRAKGQARDAGEGQSLVSGDNGGQREHHERDGASDGADELQASGGGGGTDMAAQNLGDHEVGNGAEDQRRGQREARGAGVETTEFGEKEDEEQVAGVPEQALAQVRPGIGGGQGPRIAGVLRHREFRRPHSSLDL